MVALLSSPHQTAAGSKEARDTFEVAYLRKLLLLSFSLYKKVVSHALDRNTIYLLRAGR